MSADKPNLVIPLAASYNTRGIAGFTNASSNALDQRKINSCYEPVTNSITGGTMLYLAKRPGVADSGSTYGTSGQVAYIWELAPGATHGGVDQRWVFSVSGNDVRASSSTTTTTIVTDADAAPVYVDKTAISGVDTVVVQTRDGVSDAQRVFYSTAIATFTEISDADFTGLAQIGKMEFLDGFAFQMTTNNRIYNSDLNSLSAWGASNYITKQITQDVATGLAKLGTQIIAFGRSSMEVFINAGNATGSPLKSVPGLARHIGMRPPNVVGQRHYSAVVDGKLYWIGSNPRGVYAYNGQTAEKVSTVAIDKIINERQHYFVGRTSFNGQQAVAICLELPETTVQRWLMFFPKWNDWFEWSSTVFQPVSSPRLEDVCLGVGTNQHKLYAFGSTENYQDAGANYTMIHQFKLPLNGNHRQYMPMCGVIGDTARSALSLSVEFSDDDWQNFTTARDIDMTSGQKMLTRCGSYRDRGVRLTYTGALGLRLEKFMARVT